jgi:S-layer family protein
MDNRWRSGALTPLVVVCLASTALAQVPAGPVLAVNTYTSGFQQQPSLSIDPDGNFVVAWQSYDQDGDRWGIFGQRFDVTGARRGGEFQVNTSTTTWQFFSDVAAYRGGFVVAWASRTYFLATDVFAQRYDASGARLGGEFVVNTVTDGTQGLPNLSADRHGGFVATWSSDQHDNFNYAVIGQRLDSRGAQLGGEFQVNTYTVEAQYLSSTRHDRNGNFVVVWTSRWQDSGTAGVFGQRFDAGGNRVGGEFQLNSYTPSYQWGADLCAAADGRFVVVWESWNQIAPGNISVYARRFDAAGAPVGGAEFRVNVSTTDSMMDPAVACDAAGNFVVSWEEYRDKIMVRRFRADGTPRSGDTLVSSFPGVFVRPAIDSDAVGNFIVSWDDALSGSDIAAQRFGGLLPAALSIADGANAVLEVGDSFAAATVWRNVSGAAQTFQGHASDVTVPAGLSLTLFPDANYGTLADGAVGQCVGPCFAGTLSGQRPAGHVDVPFLETIAPDAQGQVQRWSMHVGESFSDVPRASGFYRFVETLLHRGVTGGCGGGAYCPGASTTREQMAVFLLAAKEGDGYAPAVCTAPLFGDVPASSPFCRWIEELVRRGVTSGCGGGNYCPTAPVSREQMAVFVLRTLDPNLNPPACTTPVFNDVPASSPFCRWIEELARRGIVNGCGGGNYCPTAPVTREQMAVFLTGTFGLTLYGP